MNNQELEVKLQLDETQFNNLLLMASNDTSETIGEQIDMYFCPKSSDFREYMKTKCLRIRKEGKKSSLDYKEIIGSGEEYAQQLIEYSTQIEDMRQMSFILKQLDFQLVIEIIKERYEFVLEELYKVSLDKVKNLGFFIEIEVIDKNMSYKDAGTCLKNIVEKLDLSGNTVNKEGYSNMMYQKKYGEKL